MKRRLFLKKTLIFCLIFISYLFADKYREIKNNIAKCKYSSDIFIENNLKTKYKDYKNAILVDLTSGKILYEKKGFDIAEIASLTKMMSILLIYEEIEKGKLALSDTLVASTKSSKIGGSQIYLREYEKMIVEDLLKSIIIKSANDATYLLAETIGKGHQVSNFVKKMNERAEQLGMKNTVFYYPHGLPPSYKDRKKHIVGNSSSCYDLVLLTEELLKHKGLLEYSSTWLDSIRTDDNPFQLRNTNRLIKDHEELFDGLKTGFYDKAGFCIVATAKKDGHRLVSVVLGSRNSKRRNRIVYDMVKWGYEQIANRKNGREKLPTN